jgi:hypothetical protein
MHERGTARARRKTKRIIHQLSSQHTPCRSNLKKLTEPDSERISTGFKSRAVSSRVNHPSPLVAIDTDNGPASTAEHQVHLLDAIGPRRTQNFARRGGAWWSCFPPKIAKKWPLCAQKAGFSDDFAAHWEHETRTEILLHVSDSKRPTGPTWSKLAPKKEHFMGEGGRGAVVLV